MRRLGLGMVGDNDREMDGAYSYSNKSFRMLRPEQEKIGGEGGGITNVGGL